MTVSLEWYAANANVQIYNVTQSGLGLYGAGGFGASIVPGEWNGRTFVSDPSGIYEGPEVNNCKYISPTGTILGQAGAGIALNCIPNYLATLNPRIVSTTPIRVQNVSIRTYDRVSANNPPSGVTVAIYQVIHPDQTQNANGSGGTTWTMHSPTGNSPLSLVSSPATSGLSPSGANSVDTRHDWYVAVSVSPNSVGVHTQMGLWVEYEYL